MKDLQLNIDGLLMQKIIKDEVSRSVSKYMATDIYKYVGEYIHTNKKDIIVNMEGIIIETVNKVYEDSVKSFMPTLDSAIRIYMEKYIEDTFKNKVIGSVLSTNMSGYIDEKIHKRILEEAKIYAL